MTSDPTFDPFHNRLCRDIRNALSVSFIKAIQQGNMNPVRDTAQALQGKAAKPFMQAYIKQRLSRYQEVFDDRISGKPLAGETYRIACSMWNRSLFFEFHEWLEHSWHQAAGREKQMLQALIRSAGAYLLLEAGRMNGAQKLAAKAVAGLRQIRSLIPAEFDVDLLIRKLTALDPPPPRFTC